MFAPSLRRPRLAKPSETLPGIHAGDVALPKSSLSQPRLRREILRAGSILVLGVGNRARGDDAAGVLCAEAIKKTASRRAGRRLKVLVGGEAPENCTGAVRRFHPDLVLIIDAVLGPHAPGTVFIVDLEELPDETASTHRVSLALLVSYLEKEIGSRTLLIGIQPARMGFGEPVSDEVEKAAQGFSRFLVDEFLGRPARAGRRRLRSSSA